MDPYNLAGQRTEIAMALFDRAMADDGCHGLSATYRNNNVVFQIIRLSLEIPAEATEGHVRLTVVF